MQAAWDEKILELVLQRLSDHTEKCREVAIQLISDVACAITEVINPNASHMLKIFMYCKCYVRIYSVLQYE